MSQIESNSTLTGTAIPGRLHFADAPYPSTYNSYLMEYLVLDVLVCFLGPEPSCSMPLAHRGSPRFKMASARGVARPPSCGVGEQRVSTVERRWLAESRPTCGI